AVEEWRVLEADEELAVARIGVLRPRHRHGAALMRFAVKLRLELLARAPGAGAGRIAGLRHEAVDDAVEDDAVVEAVAHQFLDARDVARRKVWPHRDRHRAACRFQDQHVVEINGHGSSLDRCAFYLASAATCMRTMRSGLLTAPLFASEPFLIL